MTSRAPAAGPPDDGVTDEVRSYLAEALGDAPGPGEDYFATGRVNSLFALQLIVFVEARFGLVVEPEDLDLAHFRTATAIASFVAAKRAATDAAGRR
ncbi:acyl carrier protein [Symbioplanes lichenis]|uniref:acyl carrier protein n=1 Tax=Symbioplanes lichenis TaxID=1629072 RepID=UPI00273941A7|nr:phosphopantetheine-binding protein [Actinoplanes lichenis]